MLQIKAMGNKETHIRRMYLSELAMLDLFFMRNAKIYKTVLISVWYRAND